MKNLKTIATSLSGFTLSGLPFSALAQTLPSTNITTPGQLQNLLCNYIAGWMFTFLVVLVVVFVLVAAFKYLTAAGDPEKVKSAGNTLIYAAVAIVVALFARGLPYIISNILQSSSFTAC